MNIQPGNVLVPSTPKRLDELQLPIVMMRDMLLKTIFRKNLDLVSDISNAICLPRALTQELVDIAREQRLCEATGTHSTFNGSEMSYQLTDAGKTLAQDALTQSEYFGAMPVPLNIYHEQVKRQSIRNTQITRQQLISAMQHLVLPDGLLDQLGPAVASGRSILMYGPAGNGKSSISRGIRDAIGGMVYVPRAIEYAGQVITVYDPVVHSTVEEDERGDGILRHVNRFDERYVKCKRPTVITGGELSLNMLDLVYDPTTRTYQAPLQLKCTGGIFIIDDLGRQVETPQSLINRWILPLEENRDVLTLPTGEKLEVPFDTLVIFSTNFHPNKILDQAALRRIFFKIEIESPSQNDFLEVFVRFAKQKDLPLDEKTLLHLLNNKYPKIGNVYANYQPIFLVDQIISICEFEGIALQMTPGLIDRAWANMFVKDHDTDRGGVMPHERVTSS